jgi:diacylglycerol kinase (ATP)
MSSAATTAVKQCLILNPAAGSAQQAELLEGLRQLGSVWLVTAQAPGDATAAAKQALREGCTRVIAAGGDGTINEVVNGLAADFSQAELGVLPLGTGNDFARSIGMPLELPAAIATLLAGHTRPVDVVRVTSESCPLKHFINVSAGGFSAVVDQKMEAGSKDFWGSLAYALSAIKALPEMQSHLLRVELDDETLEAAAVNVVVANGRFVAGGIPVAPRASLDDGLLDVLIFRALPLAQLALSVPRTLSGQHLDAPGDDEVVFRQSRRVVLTADPPLEFNTDGELTGCTPVTFEILPRALRVVVGDVPG